MNSLALLTYVTKRLQYGCKLSTDYEIINDKYMYQLSSEPPHHNTSDVRCMYIMMEERRKVNLPCDFRWGLHGWLYIYAFMILIYMRISSWIAVSCNIGNLSFFIMSYGIK